MIIAYYSRTGNVRDFVNWYLIPTLGDGYQAKNIEEWVADEPYILVTPTYDFGEVPDYVDEWLDTTVKFKADYGMIDNSEYIKGVIGSGNKNFGSANYCGAADKISEQYVVLLIHTFELKGNEKEAETIRQRIEEDVE